MEIFFTADQHFSHKNIIRYCNRPFSSIEEMDEILIERWNKKIKSSDDVYILGDFCWNFTQEKLEEYCSRLNGRKWIIFGNHDNKKLQYIHLFQWQCDILERRFGNKWFVLCHYPMLSWNRSFHGSYHLYGHIHTSTLPFIPEKSMNVGVDAHKNYEPFSFDEIIEKFQ